MSSPPQDEHSTKTTTTETVGSDLAFAYEGQTIDGQTLSGTIDAPDADAATRQLNSLRVRVMRIEPVHRAKRTAALRGEDFVAFNQQLAQLTAAGLPIEHGLRLIAQDMRRGRLAETVRQVAAELERGTPLPEAFARHQGRFPPLYAQLVSAGLRTGNLPGVLLNLGRHLELVGRLRGMVWRAAAYPLMVVVGLAIIVAFLSVAVIPQFRQIFTDMELTSSGLAGSGIRVPAVTRFVLSTPDWLPQALAVAGVVVALLVVAWMVLRWTGRDRAVADALVVPLPLIGPILRQNLIARWCDALNLGVRAGLDLPAAIGLAGGAVGSPALRRDGQALVDALNRGEPLDRSVRRTELLPTTVVAAIEIGSAHHDLPTTLDVLTRMYQQQAELRLNLLPAILTPVLLLLIAAVVGLVVLGLFAPFLTLIQAIAG